MSAARLVDDIKGTTSVRLFLFLSFGILLSQFVPQVSGCVPLIVVVGIFVIAVILYLCGQFRLSICLFYLLLVAYGILFAQSGLFMTERNFQSSGVRDALMTLFAEREIASENLPLLSALTLGERTVLSPDLVSNFRASGVAHVLVVSGMHVGFLYLLVSFLIRRIQNRYVSAIAGLSILWGYAAIVGLTLSVCRAAFMFSVLLMMKVVGERYRSFHALFMAAFLQLLITPSALFDIGFQLSYSAVLSILVFYPLFPKPFFEDRKSSGFILLGSPSYLANIGSFSPDTVALISLTKKHLNSVLSFVYSAIRLTISAQILIAPLVAYYFGQFPLYFVLTNLAVTLLVPVIFIGGFMVLIPYLGTLIAYPLNFLLTLLQTIVTAVASMPMSLVQVRISFLALVLVYMLIALVVWYAYSGRK